MPERRDAGRTVAAVDEREDGRYRLVARVHGVVQGVGFRYFTRRLLVELGLDGTAENRSDGTVEVVAAGSADALRRLARELRGPRAPGHVSDVDVVVEPA